MHDYLTETKMLDYSNENIKQLIRERKWSDMAEFERLKAIYTFVRDEILFGYNVDDSVPASRVLRDGYGQCNTKGTLFMALLRACDIPCRVHGFTIDKKLQKGAMTGIVYRNAPQNVFHSWVEVYFENRWYELEAFILDMGYLKKLQAKYSECTGAFCGFGVAVKDFKNPVIDFDRNNTYIQSEGINQDFGVYDSPDELLKEHHQEMSRVKAFLYRNWGRHMMNRNVRKIRGKYNRIWEVHTWQREKHCQRILSSLCRRQVMRTSRRYWANATSMHMADTTREMHWNFHFQRR